MPLVDQVAAQPGRRDPAAADRAPDNPAGERRRRLIVRLVIAWFLLLVIEGSLRKWLLPQYSQILFFIRDPLALAIYVLALRNGAFRPLHPMLGAGLAFALLAVPIAAMQSLGGGDAHLALFAVYGWRNYFWDLPLAFVIATQFRPADLAVFCRVACVALMLSAPLAAAQFMSPADSRLNVGSSEDEALQFMTMRSANGHIRPSGPFTSILGMVEFTASTAAFLLAYWNRPRRERPLSMPLLVCGALAVAVSMAVSGSRTMFVHVALVVAAGMLSGILMNRPERMARATAVPLLLTLAFGLLFPLVAPEGYSAIATRWDEAHAEEQAKGVHGVAGRFGIELLDFTRVIDQVPLIGFGLGLGGNAAVILDAGTVGNEQIPYVETDWSRHMVDLGPPLGTLFIIYRIIFTLWLGMQAVRATRRSADPLPILLFGYVGIQLLYAQISGNGVVNAFAWLYVGFCIAACRSEPGAETAAAHAAGSEPAAADLAPVRPPNLMA